MKIKNIFFGLFLISATTTVFAQHNQENVDSLVFQAMNDELDRNIKNLKIDNYPSPFYIDFSIAKTSNFEIEAKLGAITRSNVTPVANAGAIKMLTGEYKVTSEVAYGRKFFVFDVASDLDYDVLRKKFWYVSDFAYKDALRMLINKYSYLNRYPRRDEYAEISDLSVIKPVTSLANGDFAEFDKSAWEANIRKLSAIFKDYSDLYNSDVYLSGKNVEMYLISSEGTKIKTPLSYASIEVRATTRTTDGVEISDSKSFLAGNINELSMEKIESNIREFAENLLKLKGSEEIEEFYSGPVMLEGAACLSLFNNNIIKNNALIDTRSEEGKIEKNFENRFGKKIVDTRLSIKNYSDLDKYNGVKLLGAYQIDGEGVVPPKEIVLVENGLLKNFLNGRIPMPKAKESTGSAKFSISNILQTVVAPGTIHIYTKNATKDENMKRALLKAAKEQGSDYAYIIRRIAGNASLVYRVDKDGKETLVRSVDMSDLNLKTIKKLMNISNKELVSNYLYSGNVLSSIIYPSSIIVEDVELSRTTPNKQKDFAVKHPLVK